MADILKYHVLGAMVPSDSLVSGDYTTLNGDSVTITVSDDGSIMVNDANVIVADIVASNGIIHVIDKVLLPAADVASTETTSTPCPICSFCPDGLNDPELVLPDDAGTTCLEAQLYASTLTENDELCPTVKLAEMLCCPPCPTDGDATTTAATTEAPDTTTEAPPPEVEESMSMSAPMSMEMSTPMSMSASMSASMSMSMSMSAGAEEKEEEITSPPLVAKADKESKAKKDDSKTSKETPFDGDAKAEKASSSKSGKSSKSKGSKGSGGGEVEEKAANMSMSMSHSMSHSMSVSTTSWLPSSRYLRN